MNARPRVRVRTASYIPVCRFEGIVYVLVQDRGEGEGEHREGASEREREISNWIGKSSSNQEGGRLGTATGNPLFCVITV